MALHGSHNRGTWHAVHRFGQRTLCGNRRAIMACELAQFRDGREQCKRCAAKLAEMDARQAAKQVGTIDLTPTWSGVLPVYLAAICDGTPAAQAAARSELMRMAKLADAASAAA